MLGVLALATAVVVALIGLVSAAGLDAGPATDVSPESVAAE